MYIKSNLYIECPYSKNYNLVFFLLYIFNMVSYEEKIDECIKSLKKKLEDLKARFFVCILTRFGIVTPTIFR
jgi:hypothetical protein